LHTEKSEGWNDEKTEEQSTVKMELLNNSQFWFLKILLF